MKAMLYVSRAIQIRRKVLVVIGRFFASAIGQNLEHDLFISIEFIFILFFFFQI